MIENFDEVKSYFETNKDNAEVIGYVKGFTNLDGVKNFLETNEDGKKYLGTYGDSRVTKGIETFKTNTLPSLIEIELKKLNPTLDERDLRIQALERENLETKSARNKETLQNKALKIASEKNLPVDMVSFFLGQDEESTIGNLTSLENSLTNYSKSIRESILKDGSHVPEIGDKTAPIGTITQAEYDKNKNDLDWYAKNKEKVMASYRKKLIK